METKKSIDEKIKESKGSADYFQQELENDVNRVMSYFNAEKIIGEAKTIAVKLINDRRTWYVLGGIIVSSIVVRLLFRRKRTTITQSNPNAIVTSVKRPSFFASLLMNAMQAFILHVARKLLTEYLDKKKEAAMK